RCYRDWSSDVCSSDLLERKGSIFQTTADSEIILHLLARPADNGASVLSALRRIEGAFSLLIMSERELIAVRDPFGWRPLSLGKQIGRASCRAMVERPV